MNLVFIRSKTLFIGFISKIKNKNVAIANIISRGKLNMQEDKNDSNEIDVFVIIRNPKLFI